MTKTALAGIGGREALARGVLCRAVARLVTTRELHARRSVHAHRLGLDDATLAAYGYPRRALEECGRGGFAV